MVHWSLYRLQVRQPVATAQWFCTYILVLPVPLFTLILSISPHQSPFPSPIHIHQPRAHTHTHARTHGRTLTLAQTHTHSHSHTYTDTHTHTLELSTAHQQLLSWHSVWTSSCSTEKYPFRCERREASMVWRDLIAVNHLRSRTLTTLGLISDPDWFFVPLL